MTYEELKISIDINGYANILPIVGRKCLDENHWFVICDDGDCHLFDRYGKEDDISKVKEIYEDMIPKDIKKIVIPNNVTSIENWAFFSCSGLKNVTIPDSVTNIGINAFNRCGRLENMMIPNSVTSIRDCAFFGCNGLMSVTIPNSVTSIGDLAFKWNDNLKKIVFKGKSFNQVKSMENYPFGIEDESIIKCN